METLLQSWGVQQNIIGKFIQADVDIEILKGLEDKDYDSFFPTLGSKVRFRSKLQEWRNQNNSVVEDVEKQSEPSAPIESDMVASNFEPPLAALSLTQRSPIGMRYKPPAQESLRNDSILETIAQNLSSDTVNSSLKESLGSVDDLKQLLRDSILGCGILSYYEANHCLTKFYEKEVSKIVITHELQCDSRSKITSAKLISLRDLLVQVFPTIEPEKWYSPFKVGTNGERNYASGKLQEQYLYIRKILLGSGLTVSLKRQKGNQRSQFAGTVEGSREHDIYDMYDMSYDEDSRPELNFVETVTSPGFHNSDSLSSQEAPGPGSYASTPDINISSPEIYFRCADYDSKLRKRFLSMLTSGRMTNITIACEGKKIKCHQLMLCACSQYFDELLFENPCQHPLVFLKDIKFSELRIIVDFIYTGELKISIEKLPMLLAAAECLQIKDLIENLRMPDSSSSRARNSDLSNSIIMDQSFPARTKNSYHQNEGRSRKSTHQSNVESDASNSCSVMIPGPTNSHDRQNLNNSLSPSFKTAGLQSVDGRALKRIKLEHSDHSDFEGSENQGFETWPS